MKKIEEKDCIGEYEYDTHQLHSPSNYVHEHCNMCFSKEKCEIRYALQFDFDITTCICYL